jgi:hypothetical protein
MTLSAGFGVGTITPPTPVALAGFGEPQLATEVHDDLQARAVLLQAAQGTVCLVVCDLLGMSAEFSEPVRAAVAERLGLPLAAVLLSSIHTHSGPSAMAGTAALGWPTPEGYLDLLRDGCVAAADEAATTARAAEVRYGRWPLPDGLSINRRGHPYDPWFSALDVAAADTGERLGTIANVAIHPVALGPECLAVSADWVTPFRDAMQERAGGTTVLLSGALGDVNPTHVHRQHNDCGRDGFEEAAELGADVAQALGAVLGEAEHLPDAGVRVVADRHLEVPIGGTGLAAARRADTMPVELVEWEVGPVRVVSVPGEAFSRFGREVEASRDGRILLAGLAPQWQGYFPVPWEDGGYEEGVSFGRSAVNAVFTALLERPV